MRPGLVSLFLVAAVSGSTWAAAMPQTAALNEFPLKSGDKVLWYGSSSTMIGVWPRAMEFLLHTRHPDIMLQFERRGIGGATFTTAVKEINGVLERIKPNVVVFNFGANDSVRGLRGLPGYEQVMAESVARARVAGARVVLLTPQTGDERIAGTRNDFLGVYGRTTLDFAHSNGISALDVYTPLDDMLNAMQHDVSDYTINKDRIHLTDSGYVAWAYFIYEGLNPPPVETSAEFGADGQVTHMEKCHISNIVFQKDHLEFDREDLVLPLLPPNPLPVTAMTPPTKGLAPAVTPVLSPPMAYSKAHWSDLPPRKYCPMEQYSRYMLKVEGLSDGVYAINVDGKPLGSTGAGQLKEGVNLNSVLLDSGFESPWRDLTLDLWQAKNLNAIGRTKFRIEVRKKE